MKNQAQRMSGGGRRSIIIFIGQFLCVVLLLLGFGSDDTVATQAADDHAPSSSLATPLGEPGSDLVTDTVDASGAGTIPPLNVLSGTLALPLVISQLPQFFPMVVNLPSTNLPINPHPAFGAVGQSPNVYLSWQLDNVTGGLQYYEIYLDANNDTPQTLIYRGALPRMAYDPATFLTDTQYYWQVVTVDERGLRVASPVWAFRTEAVPTTPDVEAMVYIPAGEFRMGCDPGDNAPAGCIPKYQDTPQHTVYLDAYEIDKYEVTNGQYKDCVNSGYCHPPRRTNSHQRKSYYNNADYIYYPVLYVSWWDAQDYCGWKGKRLPTEAEWEKAARGPIDTRSWPWGEEFPDCTRLNYTDNRSERWTFCLADTNKVGSYPSGASPYGVMDMAGNVFEWVADIFDAHYHINYYSISPYYNPTGPNLSKEVRDNPYFIIRGGSYRPNWFYARTFHRHHGHHGDSVGDDKPFYRNDQVGFRCARSSAE